MSRETITYGSPGKETTTKVDSLTNAEQVLTVLKQCAHNINSNKVRGG